MDGFVEGVDLRSVQASETPEGEDETDVTIVEQWRSLVGRVVEEVAAAWHVPNEGCPKTLWAIRLTLSGAFSVAIGLGEIRNEALQYQPDALVVIFDETIARAYCPLTCGRQWANSGGLRATSGLPAGYTGR